MITYPIKGSSMRLSGHTTPTGAPVTITFNGRAIAALEGESVAAALAAHGIVALGRPRTEPAAERGDRKSVV